MRRLLIATALVLVTPLVAAQAYKWTDAKGTVHYSDAPPPQGTKYNKITTTGTVEAPAAATATTTSSSDDSGDSAAKPNPNSGFPVADTPENRVKLCANLKTNMDALKNNGPVVMEIDGKQAVLSAEQRQQQQSVSQSQYAQYCAGQ